MYASVHRGRRPGPAGRAAPYTSGAGVAVARQGQAAPDGNGLYATFPLTNEPPPVINAAGQVGFRAGLTDGPGDAGLFRRDGATTAVIALAGTAAPGGAGTFAGITTPAANINAGGQVTFISLLSAGGSDGGVFRGDGTTTVAVALTGMAAPRRPGRSGSGRPTRSS